MNPSGASAAPGFAPTALQVAQARIPILIKARGSFALLPLLAELASPAFSAVNDPARLNDAYGKVPLQFEANRGQADATVRFLAHGAGYGLYLTSEEAVLVLAKPSEKAQSEPSEAIALRVNLVGAQSTPAVDGADELPGKASYFIGHDPSKWHTNVPTYAKVRYSGVYPGIDLVYYGKQRQLEYDFVVAPGADPDKIALAFEGADALEIDAQGDLVLHTATGDVRQHKPVVYQEINGTRREIDGGYARKDATHVGFAVDEYDGSRPLVIDPVLSYSTYLGGSAAERPRAIAIDSDGNAYVTGDTYSTNFPMTPGAFRPSPTGADHSIFVAKLNSSGSAVLLSAYFGGDSSASSLDAVLATGIAVDSARNVYVTGVTSSATFPTTPGALQTSKDSCCPAAFVTKLNPAGSALVYSTYLGGNNTTGGVAIAVDALGSAYVTGWTEAQNFPTTPGAFQTSQHADDAFVAKLDPAGAALVYSTYLGGSQKVEPFGQVFDFEVGKGIAVDSLGQAYVVGSTQVRDFPTTPGAFRSTLSGNGEESFVTKLNAAGSALVYSTYFPAHIAGVAIDASGHAYVTGTDGPALPVTPGAFQTQKKPGFHSSAFVTKFDTSGSALVYSTYLGGSGNDSGNAIALDVDGNAFVTGSTTSTDFPLTGDARQPGFSGNTDAFVTMLNPSGSVAVYSTYLGGTGVDKGYSIAVDTGGNAYVAGETGPLIASNQPTCWSCTDVGTDDFPTTPLAFQSQYGGGVTDAFVVKIAAKSGLSWLPAVLSLLD